MTSYIQCAAVAVAALALGACAAEDSAHPAGDLALPGATFYPESLDRAADGSLYVGSFGTGEIVRFAPGSSTAEDFATSPDIRQAAGVLVDNNAASLYVCANDRSTTAPLPPTVHRFDLASGVPSASYPLPAPAFCNDLTRDGDGNIYVSDSTGKVYRLPRGGSALALWSADPLLASSAPNGFGANGIAWDGARTIYVSNFDENRLLRIAIGADGSAGRAEELPVAPTLNGPDAVRRLDDRHLLVVQQPAGSVVRVDTATGAATVAASGIDMPTSVVAAGGDLLVTEGQLGHLLGTVSGPPHLPFAVRRFPIIGE